MSKKNIYILSGLIIVLAVLYSFSGSDPEESAEISVEVERGLFEIKVFTTGELEAKNSVDIKGPAGLRAAGIWRVQITDLIPEGTKVKKGEYIASLDKSELSDKIIAASSNLSKSHSQYTQTQMDTILDLRQVRLEIINLDYDLKDKTIILKQSQYEPPAVIRQAEIALEKAKRAYNDKVESYEIKTKQSAAKMQSAAATLSRDQNKYDMLRRLQEGFTILAPEDGMVIYEREWNGKKKTTGSEVGAWDPTVATLPDLSSMISQTYVNEVDIRKVQVGQKVEISLDAFPDKSMSGVVIQVANMGEQLPNTDSKVFEVRIEIDYVDSMIRPGMTTGNNIIAQSMEDVLYTPLETIHSQEDTLIFVYLKSGWGIVKKEIKIGDRNDNYAIVLSGLEEGDEVLLSTPEDGEDLKLEPLADNL